MSARVYELIYIMVPDVTEQAVTDMQSQVEGIVQRQVIPETPVRVEYHLTAKGEALTDVIQAVSTWAERWSGSGEGPS